MKENVCYRGPLLITGTVWLIVVLPPDNEPPFLTGVGLLGDDLNGEGSGFWVNRNPNTSYIEFDSLEHLECHPFDDYKNFGDTIIYPFHDACWLLLLCRVVGEPSDKLTTAVSRALFYLFQCAPKNEYRQFLETSEYGGGEGFQVPVFCLSIEDTRVFLADPTDGPAPRIKRSVPNLLFHSLTTATRLGSSSTEDVFRYLPPEIIGQILVQLRSRDVCELRLASRAVASVSSPIRLSQEFWKSRFGVDMEMGGVYALQPYPRHGRHGTAVDWRKLYLLIRESLEEERHPALWNKMRIWKCLDIIWCSLGLLLEDQSRSWQDWAPRLHDPELEERWTGPFVRSHSHHIFSNEKLLLPVSTPVQSPQRISVSTIFFNGKRYVCGLRVRHHSEGDVGATISKVGMNVLDTEGHFDMDAGDSLDGLLLYTAMDGVVGIEFHLRMRESSTLTSRHFGDCHGSNTVAVSSLEPPPTRDFRGIAFGFDVRRPA